MKRNFKGFLCINLLILCLAACHSNDTNPSITDTALKTAADTAIIPGTPGPSGSAPKPGDTTLAHRDSLKRASHLSDSSGRPTSVPR